MSAYSDLIIGDTPSAYWRLGEASGNAADSSGNGHTGTVTGATYGATGLIADDADDAMDFDGSSDKIAIADVLDFAWNSAFSVEAWVAMDQFGGGGTDRVIASKLDNGNFDQGWEVRLSSTTKPRFFLRSADGGLFSIDVECQASIPNGTPTHLVVTYSGSGAASGVKFYIDGAESTSVTVNEDDLGTNVTSNAITLTLAARANDVNWWSGVLDEVAIYSSALTAAQVLEHYNAGIGDFGDDPSDIAQPVQLIIDQDICTDVGDVPTVPVAIALERMGECDILGVIVTSGNIYSAPLTDVLFRFCKRPNPTIGAWMGDTLSESSDFAQLVVARFLAGATRADYGDSLTVYRTLLHNAADNSVVICITGTAQSLDELLDSPADAIDSRTGLALITAKVRRLVVMGGDYPTSGASPEWNFSQSIPEWVNVINNWPGEIVFEGNSVGNVIEIFCPAASEPGWDPLVNPIRYAHDLWSGGVDSQAAWDELAVFYAVRGTVTGLGFGGINGTNTVSGADGTNDWAQTPDSQHSYLDYSALPATVEDELNEVFLASLTSGGRPVLQSGGSLSAAGLMAGGAM